MLGALAPKAKGAQPPGEAPPQRMSIAGSTQLLPCPIQVKKGARAGPEPAGRAWREPAKLEAAVAACS